jgi:hypothetical protein
MANSFAMIVKRIAVVLVLAVSTLLFFTRPDEQEPHISVQNPAPAPARKAPSLLAHDLRNPTSPPVSNAADSGPPVSEAADKALRARITAYWEARTKFDLLTAFTFYEPEFQRQYTPQEFLLKFHRLVRFKPQFLGIDRIRYETGGTNATAFIRLRTQPDVVLNQEVVTVTEEYWLLLSGTWCKKGESLVPTI